jgi:hypothetical protein
VVQPVSGNISAWEQDPGSLNSPDGGVVLHRNVPSIEAPPFATRISAVSSPPADNYDPGTPGFRYWTCADALRRAADLWGGLVGHGNWHSSIANNVLKVMLDEGVDLNAYYDREALNFFHAPIGGRMIYSGESPDIVCHEFGHAVLDALRPQLWDVASFEPPAFHESFGDMSAILSALQVPSIRVAVLQETNNEIYRSSRVSRLAEQLGWAIRQKWPDQVEGDCLRNAVSSLFYQDPDQLPTSAPAKQLSSEPHSFSRVFTAAFMETLSLMFAGSGKLGEESLQQVSFDLGRILVNAIMLAPVVPEYFSQIGGHMIALATAECPHYGDAVKTATVLGAEASLRFDAGAPGSDRGPDALPAEEIDVSGYGLTVSKVDMVTAGQPKRFGIAGAALTTGDAPSACARRCALGYFEDLIRRGRLDYGVMAHPRFAVVAPASMVKTHQLTREADRVVLRRIRIDCGLHKAPDGAPITP